MRLAEEPPVVGFACFFVERLRTEICMEGTVTGLAVGMSIQDLAGTV
jgi:hypothetical protein